MIQHSLSISFSKAFRPLFWLRLALHFMAIQHPECPLSSFKKAAGSGGSPSIGGKQAQESGWVIEGHVLLHSDEASPGQHARWPRCRKECCPGLPGNVLFISSRPMRGCLTKAFIQMPNHSHRIKLGLAFGLLQGLYSSAMALKYKGT